MHGMTMDEHALPTGSAPSDGANLMALYIRYVRSLRVRLSA